MIKNKASIVSVVLNGLAFILFTLLGIILSLSNSYDSTYIEAMKYVNVVALVFAGLVAIVLLIALVGNSLTMSQAITYLWPNKDNEKAKILYRDAVWRLRETLEEIRFPCVNFGRAILTLDKSNIKCDYYDYLSKKRRLKDSDIFLISYDWADEFI